MEVPSPGRSAGQTARLQRLKIERERRRQQEAAIGSMESSKNDGGSSESAPKVASNNNPNKSSRSEDASYESTRMHGKTMEQQASFPPHLSQHPSDGPVQQGRPQQNASVAVDMGPSKPSSAAPLASSSGGQAVANVESPIPQTIQRALGDRSYEKRKSAAVEIEAIVKALAEPILTSVMTAATATFIVTPQNANCIPMIQSVIQVLAKDFCSSMNSNFRKGGLIGLAATAIGLMVPPSLQSHAGATNMNHPTAMTNTHPHHSALMGNPSYNSALPPKQQQQQNSNHVSQIAGSKDLNFHTGQIPNNFLLAYFLDSLLKPVLQCFDDPESRVRYYACESLYNLTKVARGAIFQSTSYSTMQGLSAPVSPKRHFSTIFDGLTKLYADVDTDVKNGAILLDRLIKDVVTESSEVVKSAHASSGSPLFQMEEDFLPLLQTYIRRTNPSIRQLLVGWITALNSIPDISILDYLPDFLDGLFNMLSDANREIRQAADSVLGEFLREIRSSSVVQLGPIIGILTQHCTPTKDRLNRLTAVSWLAEIIDHPTAGYEALLPFHADILVAFLSGISDVEPEIRKVSQNVCNHLLEMVGAKVISVEDNAVLYGKQLSSLLTVLQKELVQKSDIPTKLATLEWINMLVEKRREIYKFVSSLLPVLLKTLNDPSDDVVLLDLQVLSRIALLPSNTRVPSYRRNLLALVRKESSKSDSAGTESHEDANFVLVVNAILALFSSDRKLMENRGSLIVRKLCVLLNAQHVYIRIAAALTLYETKVGPPSQEVGCEAGTLEFISTTVQILNLILLTAPELHSLRQMLRFSLPESDTRVGTQPNSANLGLASKSPLSSSKNAKKPDDFSPVFSALFRCWCHNNIAAFSLCLIAQRYDLAFALVKKFSDMDVTVGFLMQVDKLVHLLESPIFIHLRLQLLDVESPNHVYLLKSCYGLLMLLPQSDAFRSLNDRLTAVCNLRDNLGIPPSEVSLSSMKMGPEMSQSCSSLLDRFDAVTAMHNAARKLKATPIRPENHTNNVDVPSSFDGAVHPHQRSSPSSMVPTSTVPAVRRGTSTALTEATT